LQFVEALVLQQIQQSIKTSWHLEL